MFGKKHSPESIAKMKAKLMGNIPWNKGKKMSEDFRIKCRQRQLGVVRSPETCKRIGDGHRGEKNYHWKGGYENKLFLNNQRRIRKEGNGGSHSLEEWLELKRKYNNTCPACLKREPLITLSRDHINPISLGGTDDITNIQPLCRACNSKKNNRSTVQYPIISSEMAYNRQ